MVVEQIKTGKHVATGKWVAECYSKRVGKMEQWGTSELDALRKLSQYVEIQGEQWPKIEGSDK